MNTRYEPEILPDDDDDGTMPGNVRELADLVVGHKIVSAEHGKLTLDNGKTVVLANDGDCCAYTELQSFLLHPERIDHVITGIGTTGGFTRWHIYADMGDVLELTVGWSCGNPFYYGYGFDISVLEEKRDLWHGRYMTTPPLPLSGAGGQTSTSGTSG